MATYSAPRIEASRARLTLSPHLALFAVALVIRLVFVLLIDPHPNVSGGDTLWFMNTGRDLVTGSLTFLPTPGPVYLIFAGEMNTLFGGERGLTIIRVLNAGMGAALCVFIYMLGKRYLNERAGLLAAVVLVVSPAFIIEAGNAMTESVFLFLLFGALSLYATRVRVGVGQATTSTRMMSAVGVLLGLATLTRAVAMLFPLILIVHLVYGERRRAVRLVAVLVVAYVLTVSTWTIFCLARWGEFVVAARGLAANIYLGTTQWCGPECTDANAGIKPGDNNDTQYVQNTVATITGDPLGYLRTRFTNLSGALLQPHGTVYYPGESIKALVAQWWSTGHTPGDLPRLFASDAFWPKLALYIFHYAALFFGFIGMLIGLRRFWERVILYGAILYFLGIHTVIMANPRYLLPIEPALWLFAAYAIVQIATRREDQAGQAVAPTLKRDPV